MPLQGLDPFDALLGLPEDAVQAELTDRMARLRAKHAMLLRQLPAPDSAYSAAELERLEDRLDAALRALHVAYDPMAALPADALRALASGDEVEAVWCYRRATGASLREALHLVRSVDQTGPSSHGPN